MAVGFTSSQKWPVPRERKVITEALTSEVIWYLLNTLLHPPSLFYLSLNLGAPNVLTPCC